MQKTAYEMRISDWSSDVCSSDLLFLLHPIMPFLTEELWQQTGEGEAQLMTLAPWPRFADSLVDAEADATLGWVVRVIGQIRAVRSEMNVPPGARIALIVHDASTDSKARTPDHEAPVKTMARVETIAFDQPVPKDRTSTRLNSSH